jgi:hypothetical protein
MSNKSETHHVTFNFNHREALIITNALAHYREKVATSPDDDEEAAGILPAVEELELNVAYAVAYATYTNETAESLVAELVAEVA